MLKFIFRAIIILIVYVLYLFPLVFFASDGSSNNYKYLFYILVLFLPLNVSCLFCRSNLSKLFGLIGTATSIYFYVFYGQYHHHLSPSLIYWCVITCMLLCMRERAFPADDYRTAAAIFPVLFLILSSAIYYNMEYRQNYFFHTKPPTCKYSIDIRNMPGLSDSTHEAIFRRDLLIAPENVCVDEAGRYDFQVRLVKNKYYERDSVTLRARPADFDQLVSEIIFVSNFHEGYIHIYASGSGQGFLHQLGGFVESTGHSILHPIETIESSLSFLTLIPGIAHDVYEKPSLLVDTPVALFNDHLESVENNIAIQNNINITKIYLPETVRTLKHARNIQVAGEGAFHAVAAYASYKAPAAFLPLLKRVEETVKLSKIVPGKSAEIAAKQASHVSENKAIHTQREVKELDHVPQPRQIDSVQGNRSLDAYKEPKPDAAKAQGPENDGLTRPAIQPSILLARQLEAAGQPRPFNHAAHHIVSASDPRAATARNILDRFGIDFNAADNGVWLPVDRSAGKGALHRGKHTNEYYQELNRRLRNARSKDEALEILKQIRYELENDKFPKWYVT